MDEDSLYKLAVSKLGFIMNEPIGPTPAAAAVSNDAAKTEDQAKSGVD